MIDKSVVGSRITVGLLCNGSLKIKETFTYLKGV